MKAFEVLKPKSSEEIKAIIKNLSGFEFVYYFKKKQKHKTFNV
jgi:hypothetical protein